VALRRAAEDSRERLLAAGEEILDEMVRSGRADPLRLLRPTEIAERAGRSKALLYHLWPVGPTTGDRLARYRQDLLDRVLRRPYDAAGVAAAAAEASSDDIAQVVRIVGGFEFDRFAPGGTLSEAHRASVILAAAAELGGEVAAPHTIAGSASGEYAELQDLYAILLDQHGLQVRPPLTLAHLTAMLSAMTEGFALEVWYSGDLLRLSVPWTEGGRTDEWSPFAIAVLGVAEKLTEPRTCDGPNCDQTSCVLFDIAVSARTIALCDRHVWSTLATDDDSLSPRIVHREPDPTIAKQLFADAPRVARRVVSRWLNLSRAARTGI
jgi:AcrR family transcriptional regulator